MNHSVSCVKVMETEISLGKICCLLGACFYSILLCSWYDLLQCWCFAVLAIIAGRCMLGAMRGCKPIEVGMAWWLSTLLCSLIGTLRMHTA